MTDENRPGLTDRDDAGENRNTGRRLRYRLLTGPDDASFCARVSQALEEGYVLYGSPAIAMDQGRIVVAQAVILKDKEDDV
ncbi:DUF1737 domain-containing protein [Thermopetrobacter sp. TC1]|uniref:DUF1737 domain-containing protein n=1 Tax=Thermopetrobacter sp. TC1 TaxID=1495045 RepID=UPI00057032B7